jgi:hypothetical protein
MHPRTFSGNDLRGKIDASNLSGTAATCGRSDRSNLQLGAAECTMVAKTEAGTRSESAAFVFDATHGVDCRATKRTI